MVDYFLIITRHETTRPFNLCMVHSYSNSYVTNLKIIYFYIKTTRFKGMEVNTEPPEQGISNDVDFAIAQSHFSSTHSAKDFPFIFDNEYQHSNGETYLRFVREVELVLVRLELDQCNSHRTEMFGVLTVFHFNGEYCKLF